MLGCIDVNQFHVEFILECIHHLFRFAEAEETVVYKDAGQLVADGFVDEHSGYRRIDAAGKGADYIVFSYFSRIFPRQCRCNCPWTIRLCIRRS